MKKLVILPAYNEGNNIKNTVEDIISCAPGYDYVVINDCSTDNTAEVCEENHIPYIDLPVNLGIGGAVQTGYRYASEHGYEIAVQLDGDGQHDASFIREMEKELLRKQADMVIGSRFIKKEGFQSSRLRRLGIAFFSRLIRLCTGTRIADPTSGFRMVGKELIDSFAKEYPRDYPEPESIVSVIRQKKKIVEIPVIMRERQGGISSISLFKSVYYMVKVTLAILVECIRKPLR